MLLFEERYVFRSDLCATEFNERDSEFGVRSSGEFLIPNAEIVNFVPDGEKLKIAK
jgi:uncharacterized protein YqkB